MWVRVQVWVQVDIVSDGCAALLEQVGRSACWLRHTAAMQPVLDLAWCAESGGLTADSVAAAQ